jgi:hypothetical protein
MDRTHHPQLIVRTAVVVAACVAGAIACTWLGIALTVHLLLIPLDVLANLIGA